MSRRRRIPALLTLWMACLPAVSSPAQQPQPVIADDAAPAACDLTPTIPGAAGSYPGHERIRPSNKPAMAPGKAVYARGEPLILQGRVFDRDCIPLEGASIELWQTDTNGKYKWETQGNLLSPESAFAGSGHAITNNLGEYEFLTIFPGTYGSRAPHIHLRITHEGFKSLSTEVFFAADHRNAGDPRLRSLQPRMRDRLMAAMQPGSPLTARFDIVLQGREKFQHY